MKDIPKNKMADWLSVIVALLTFSILVVGKTQCPDGYISDPNSRKCWKMCKTRVNWNDALAACREDGAELGVLNNRDDHDFVRTIQAGRTWIGVNDREADYHYVDSLGNELTWTNWRFAPQQDTDAGEHCFRMDNNYNGKWFGEECSTIKINYLCMAGERNVVFTLTPSTTLNREDMYAVSDVDPVKCSVYCQNNAYCLGFAFKNGICRLLRYGVVQSNFSTWNLYV